MRKLKYSRVANNFEWNCELLNCCEEMQESEFSMNTKDVLMIFEVEKIKKKCFFQII